jgi:hypothetical protein
MSINHEIARTLRFAARLATLTGNRDAAAGMTADEIAKAIREKRHSLIQACLAEQSRLRSEGFVVRLPILRDLRDEELVVARGDLIRKGQEARKAKLDAAYAAKRGIRPVRRQAPAPVRDEFLDYLRSCRPAEAAE